LNANENLVDAVFLKHHSLIEKVEVNQMRLKKPFTFKYTIFTAPLLMGTLVFLIAGFFDSNTPFEIPAASADSQYGILGQPAPELNLSDWIDGNGKKTESIWLSNYRGKVVYLYFFQDW
jgi:hypothetical protein